MDKYLYKFQAGACLIDQFFLLALKQLIHCLLYTSYDKMIGKFTGQDTPACGFSIGFERIVMLLLENGYEVPRKGAKKAYLLEKNMPKEGMLKVLSMAKTDREAGKQVLIVNMKKNKKFQKEQLQAEGYEEIIDCYADSVDQL